jgi:hypothetical protein
LRLPLPLADPDCPVDQELFVFFLSLVEFFAVFPSFDQLLPVKLIPLVVVCLKGEKPITKIATVFGQNHAKKIVFGKFDTRLGHIFVLTELNGSFSNISARIFH